jgi:YHS domain-containing protein
MVLNSGALALACLVAGGIAALAQQSQHGPISRGTDQVAIRGYDPVAYFTDGRATRGNPQFEYVWEGARWQFSSAAHRDAFAADPERYAPQFGGYCAIAMSELGQAVDANPEVWTIVDGRLYLISAPEWREQFRQNLLPASLRAAQRSYSAMPASAIPGR